MPSYTKAPTEVVELVAEVCEEYHPLLVRAGVTFDVLMASEISAHGYPAAARVKKTSTEDRILGKSDVTLYFDAEEWEGLSDTRRRALIDHELHHVTVQVIGRSQAGDPIFATDDAGRPKINIRLHDWQLGGFVAIGERWGDDAPEIRALKGAVELARQGVFDFTRADRPAEEQPSPGHPDWTPPGQPPGTVGHPAGARTLPEVLYRNGILGDGHGTAFDAWREVLSEAFDETDLTFDDWPDESELRAWHAKGLTPQQALDRLIDAAEAARKAEEVERGLKPGVVEQARA